MTGDASKVLAPGDGYEIRSVMDLYGPPIASGTYAGGALAFPMAGPAPPSPIGSNLTPPAIAPQFAVLLLTRRRP